MVAGCWHSWTQVLQNIAMAFCIGNRVFLPNDCIEANFAKRVMTCFFKYDLASTAINPPFKHQENFGVIAEWSMGWNMGGRTWEGEAPAEPCLGAISARREPRPP
jgi:hypothetical protein